MRCPRINTLSSFDIKKKEGTQHLRGRSVAVTGTSQRVICKDLVAVQELSCVLDTRLQFLQYYPGLDRGYIDSDVTHTCRNSEALHKWVLRGYNS